MGAVTDVSTYLEAQGVAGGSTGWDILRRRSMDDPVEDQLVVVSEDGGPPPEIKTDSGIGDNALKDVGVLVSVRAVAWKGDASAAKAQEVFDELHGKLDITLGTTTYLRVVARTPEPIFAGYDGKGRPKHTIAFMLLADVPSTP